MKQTMIALLLGLYAVFLGVGHAQNLKDAQKLYIDGKFLEAAEMAEASGKGFDNRNLDSEAAEAYATAAKYTSVYASNQPENKQGALYERAEALARKAVAQSPNNAKAHFEIARAVGRLSQLRGVAQAIFQGLAPQIKEELEKAIGLNPKAAEAMAALGLWHAEVSAKGAGWLYGADNSKTVPLFEQAIKLEPDVVIHRVEYAKALLLIDSNKNKDAARKQLEIAITFKPSDAAERFDLLHAKADLEKLK
jgi:tetratricopeptide (TPR) repeat protein